MAPRKPKEEGIKTPWGIYSYRSIVVLCLASYTPLGDACMRKVGMSTSVGEMEAIKTQVVEHGKQLSRIDEKVTAIENRLPDRRVVETPRPEFRVSQK